MNERQRERDDKWIVTFCLALITASFVYASYLSFTEGPSEFGIGCIWLGFGLAFSVITSFAFVAATNDDYNKRT